MPSLILQELLGGDQELTGVLAVSSGYLLVTVVDLVDDRPMGPRVAGSTDLRRLRHDLEVHQALAPLPHSRSDAIIPRVSPTDDNHLLAESIDGRCLRILGPPPSTPVAADVAPVQKRLGVLVQKLHGHVHTVAVAASDGQISRDGGSCSQHQCVVLLQQLIHRRRHSQRRLLGPPQTVVVRAVPNVARLSADESHPFSPHEIRSPLDDVDLVSLHVRHTVHHQTTWPVSSLIDGDVVPTLVELVCGG
mmetsp:Transcript_12778/g.28349  ORF Transcript_12778/g.28349 Transcript_12778/m.28349 type:complete len:248 (-) Transcript_12778:244-987(-)